MDSATPKHNTAVIFETKVEFKLWLFLIWYFQMDIE